MDITYEGTDIIIYKYFGHVTRHDGLEKTIMQRMVAGKRSGVKPRERWEKDTTYTFDTMAAASDVLTRICPEKKKTI